MTTRQPASTRLEPASGVFTEPASGPWGLRQDREASSDPGKNTGSEYASTDPTRRTIEGAILQALANGPVAASTLIGAIVFELPADWIMVRTTIARMVEREAGVKMSNREVARRCRVSHHTVAQIAQSLGHLPSDEQPGEAAQETREIQKQAIDSPKCAVLETCWRPARRLPGQRRAPGGALMSRAPVVPFPLKLTPDFCRALLKERGPYPSALKEPTMKRTGPTLGQIRLRDLVNMLGVEAISKVTHSGPRQVLAWVDGDRPDFGQRQALFEAFGIPTHAWGLQ